MKKSIFLFFAAILCAMSAAGQAQWIGNSYIVVNEQWYESTSFNQKNLGEITSLTLGGQVQTWGQSDGANNPAKMYYQIKNQNAVEITMPWKKYESNNNFFESLNNTVDISSLAAGEYTLSVWFHQPDGGQWDSNGGDNYVATFTIAAAGEEPDPTPDPAETETVYFVNADDWTGTIYAYAWKDGTPKVENASWAGVVAQKEANQIGGHDVYSYTAEKGKYETVIFNNNSSNQTSDMTWAANQYLCKNEWCADEAAVLAKLNGPVEYVSVYFINTVDWSAVNIYTWSPEVAKWPGVAMTKEAEQIAGFDVYSYTVEKGTTFGGMKFNENGGNQTGDLQWTAGKYYIYNYGPVIGWFTKEEAIANLTEPVVTYDYYIAGNEALLGADKNWGSTPAGKGMDKGADGLYTATFTLSANTEYEFKITDGQWNSESDNSHEHTTLAAVYVGVTGGNGNNIKVNLAEAKELTITFNSTEDKIYFNLDEETASLTYRVQVPEGTEACYIAGPCNSWAFREMTREGTTDIFTIDIVGAKETDEYKYACQADWAYAEVIDGGGNRTAWQELDQVEEWGKPAEVKYVLMGVNGDWTNGIPLTVNPGNSSEYMLLNQPIFSATDSIKIVKLENGQAKHWCGNVENNEIKIENKVNDNIVLKDGIYDFYYKVNDDKVYIALVGYARNVTNTYGTICLPYASASTAGATFFEVVGQEAGKVYLASVTELEAGVPYIFEKSANQIKVVYTGDKKDAPVNTDANGLIGNFTNDKVVPAGNYILYNNEFRKSDGEAKVNAYRAYLDLSAVEGGKPTHTMPGRRYIGMSVQGENVETGVEDIITTDAPVKVIENGQLIIIRDGVKYNVQGQKL